MAKSVNEYYSEKMKKLLEMQENNNSAYLSSPQNTNPPQTGRNYYDNFRTRVENGRSEDERQRSHTDVRRASPRQGRKNPLERDVIDDIREGKNPSRRGSVSASRTNGEKRRPLNGAGPERTRRQQKPPEQTAEDKRREHLKQLEAIRTAKRARVLRNLRDGLISFSLITAVLIVLVIVVYRLLFVINDISAVGGESYTSEELVAASGVDEGDHLYSFSSKEIGRLMSLRCPEVESVDVDRTPPGTIVFNITEEKPAFYADFYGEYRMLSETLRVMGSVTEEDAKSSGCPKIIVPDVHRATAGLQPEFAGVRDESYIYDVSKAVLTSALGERAGTLDLSDKYDITLTVDGKYILKLGDSKSVETKLKIAVAVLEDEMFEKDIKATIDVSDLSESSVVVDQGLEID